MFERYLKDTLIFQSFSYKQVFLNILRTFVLRLTEEKIKWQGSSFALTACLRAFRAWTDGEKVAAPFGSCALHSVKDEEERAE